MSWTPDSLSPLGWRVEHWGCSLVSSCGLINKETLVGVSGMKTDMWLG